MLAPSIILSEAWESPEFKNFYINIFNNLFEDNDDELNLLRAQTSTIPSAGSSSSHHTTPPLSHLPECFTYTPDKWQLSKYHYRWNVSRKDLQEE
jgi:hypothetical protein